MSNFTINAALSETVIFLSYVLICGALFKSRLSALRTALALGGAAAIIIGVQAAVILSGQETLALTLLPLTAYLPFSVLLYLISDFGIFETAACSVGALAVLILKSLQKTVSGFALVWDIPGGLRYLPCLLAVVFTAAVLVFVSFKFIGKAFRAVAGGSRKGRLLLSLPVVLILAMMFYFLNSTADVTVLLFTMLIALSVFLIIAKLLGSYAELAEAKRSEKAMSEYMELQRQSYDRLADKIEAGRAHRHDMRHHLAVIEGLAKQGDCGRIIEYAEKINGSLSGLENTEYCKNPEINAVLSEYIGRGERAGCKIENNIVLPAKLPFAETDVCIVLANSVENAINACKKLPEEMRRIDISAECSDGHRLFVSVKNPCPSEETLSFDKNEIPQAKEAGTESAESPESEEHGIGLRSVSRVAEKYNGFLRCKRENGEFIFQAALFYEEKPAESKKERRAALSKRALSSLASLFLGVVIMLNVFPAAAEAVSSLFSVNIRTVHSLRLGWGDNALSIDSPEFEGSGSEELNAIAQKYTEEAKEKFLWYFNRRYNGYAAEDMSYTVIRDDEKYFTARFNVTVNAGGSFDYSRWITFDKSLGRVLELGDLFKEDSGYIETVSAEILETMKYKNEKEEGRFFVEGEDAFTRISEDANFYIDNFDRLVIVFDEYEVAPGFMGSPEFIIPQKILEEIGRWTN